MPGNVHPAAMGISRTLCNSKLNSGEVGATCTLLTEDINIPAPCVDKMLKTVSTKGLCSLEVKAAIKPMTLSVLGLAQT